MGYDLIYVLYLDKLNAQIIQCWKKCRALEETGIPVGRF